MSRENVDIVRRLYESASPLTDVALVAPDAEFDFTSLYPDQPVLRGTASMRAFRDAGPWGPSIHFEPERFIDVDDDTVLVLVDATATGRGSGAPIRRRIAHEIQLRDRLVVRMKVHADQLAALSAFGIEP